MWPATVRSLRPSRLATAPWVKNARSERVSQARVEVDGNVTGEIGTGLLVLLGLAKRDTPADAEFLARLSQLTPTRRETR